MLYNINKIVHKSFIYKRWCLNIYNLQLETFLHVARTGSFTKAAEESYITPTAVIKQINLLEESLGLKLFERTHRQSPRTSQRLRPCHFCRPSIQTIL